MPAFECAPVYERLACPVQCIAPLELALMIDNIVHAVQAANLDLHHAGAEHDTNSNIAVDDYSAFEYYMAAQRCAQTTMKRVDAAASRHQPKQVPPALWVFSVVALVCLLTWR